MGFSHSLSLGRYLQPALSRDEFIQLVGQYQKTITKHLGTPCRLEIRLMQSVPKEVTSSDRTNLAITLPLENGQFTQTNPAMVAQADWDKAFYIEVLVKSADPKQSHLLGWIEFGGFRPQQASFYLQVENADIMPAMIKQNPGWRVGAGHITNTEPHSSDALATLRAWRALIKCEIIPKLEEAGQRISAPVRKALNDGKQQFARLAWHNHHLRPKG